MGKQLSEESIKFIEDNWFTMENKEIAKTIGVTPNHITVKGRELGLPDKRNFRQENLENTILSEQIDNYGPCTETVLELRARQKTSQLKGFKELIQENNLLKLKIKEDRGKRILEGIVVKKTDNLVILQVGSYKESFGYVDFYTGRVAIV